MKRFKKGQVVRISSRLHEGYNSRVRIEAVGHFLGPVTGAVYDYQGQLVGGCGIILLQDHSLSPLKFEPSTWPAIEAICGWNPMKMKGER